MNTLDEHRTADLLVAIAEATLICVTLAGVASFARLFVDSAWTGPLLTAAVVAHLTMIGARRLRRGLLVTAIGALVVMTLQITWVHYRATTTALLPTGRTRDALDADLRSAWELFGQVQAPTESTTGFVVLASLAVWVIAYLADWAAFRLWSPLESMLPGFAMAVFIAVFGAEQDRMLFTGVYVGAVVAFQLAHHLVRQSREVRWLAGAARLGTSSLLAVGAVITLLTVVGAVTIGPALPGADEEALVDLDNADNGPSSRVVVSPIVDIRGRILNQPDVEAFTVRSAVPSYWRLASLDNFNGQIWGADNKYGRVSGPLPDDFEVSAQTQVLEQQYTILNMGAVWLPAAYEPRAVRTAAEGAISYEPISGTLIVSTDLESSDGLQYELTSEIPTFDPSALAAAPVEYPQEILERYLQLPGDYSQTATATALAVTAEAVTAYDKALALQNFFRDPARFTYDIDVGQGHSNDRIDAFLASGRGYCEQFAGAYASMARAIGLPARVAVGFTWGDVDPDDPTLYRVRGEHAHAWPEVFIPDAGWVAFEPTPSRGAPNAAPWTGVAPEQSSGLDPQDGPATEGVAPTPAPAPGFEDPAVPDGSTATTDGPAADDGATTGGGTPAWVAGLGVALLVSAAVAVAYAALVVAAKWLRRRRRVAAARDDRQRVTAIWRNAIDDLSPIGMVRRESETMGEFAGRAGARAESARNSLESLSTIATEVAYGTGPVGTELVERAEEHRSEVAAAVHAEVDLVTRVRDLLDPRPLFRR